MSTKRHNYGRLAFWGVVAILATITATSAVRLRQWAREPYVTLPAPPRPVSRIEEYPCGQGRQFAYPDRIKQAYRLTK